MTEPGSRLVRRRVVAAAAAGGLLALVVIVGSSGFDVERMTFGDGVLHRYVAENLSASSEEVTADLEGHGTALRYGRIVMPLLIWIGSAGQADAMPYVQPLIMVLCAAAIAAAARLLLPESGWGGAVAPFIAMGLTTSLAGGFAEPLAIAFAMWAVVLARRERWIPAAGLLGVAMLTRENAAAVLAGLAVWTLVNRKPRGAALLMTSLVPLAVWYLAVERRFGFVPLNDPFLQGPNDAFGPPVLAAWRSLTQSGTMSTILVAVHLIAAAMAFTLWRASDLGAIASAAGLQILWNGPPHWQYAGDAVRLQVFLEVFLMLALVARAKLREEAGHAIAMPASVEASWSR